MKIIHIDGTEAMLESGGVKRRGDIRLLNNCSVGDYVIMHAGFAIEKLNKKEAQKTLKIWAG